MSVVIAFHEAISRIPKPGKTALKNKNCCLKCSEVLCPYKLALEKIADVLLELPRL